MTGRITKRGFLTSVGVLAIGPSLVSGTGAGSGSQWTSYQDDSGNRGYASKTTSPVTDFRREWSFQTQNRVAGSAPVLRNGILYVGSTDRNLYAIDVKEGTEIWSYDTGAAIRDTPVVTPQAVVVVNGDNEVYALDPETGEEVWSASERSYRYSPVSVNDTVYVTATRQVVGFAVETGEKVWTSPEIDFPTAGPAYEEGTLYVPSEYRLFAFDTETGDEKWYFDADGDIDVVPTVDDDLVYVGARNGLVYAVNTKDGNKRWEYNTRGNVTTSVAIREGTAYVAAFGSEVGTHAINTSDGTREWGFEYGSHGTGSPSVIVTDEVVYVTGAQYLYAVDIGDGSEIDRFQPNDRIETTPCLNSGVLYFGSRDHHIYAYTGSTQREPEFEVSSFRVYSDTVAFDFGETDITVPRGTEVSFQYSISNDGVGDGTFDAVFEIEDHGVTKRSITVAAGESESVEFEQLFDQLGMFEVSLNGERYGSVEVRDPENVDGAETNGEDSSTIEELPGFGIGAGIIGIGGGLAYALRKRSKEE